MLFYWGILILVISSGYARVADKTRYAARSIGHVESFPGEVQEGDDFGRSLENGVIRRRRRRPDRCPRFWYYNPVIRMCSRVPKRCPPKYYKDRKTGRCYYCTRSCPKGTVVFKPCDAKNDLMCASTKYACRDGYFWARIYFPKRGSKSYCKRCRKCAPGTYPKKKCGFLNDAVCGPICLKRGYYYSQRYRRCKRCTRCPPGYKQLLKCDPMHNYRCRRPGYRVPQIRIRTCRRGWYFDNWCKRCTGCKRYHRAIKRCSKTRNTVCVHSGYCPRNQILSRSNGFHYCRPCRKCRRGYRQVRRCYGRRDTMCVRSRKYRG